jgi:hypothetical protein
VSTAVWIAAAKPEAPERLVARVREVLDAHPEWGKAPVAEALVEAAEVLLREVLREGEGPARDRALDLLAADACVTWAFEAAADDPASLGAHAKATMERLAHAVLA